MDKKLMCKEVTMDFQSFLREIKNQVSFVYPENPRLGLCLLLTAILKQLLEKEKLAERIVEHLNNMNPLLI